MRYRDIYPGFITIFIADQAGIVHEIVPMRESPAIDDREYFIDAMRHRRMAVSDVILGRLSHVPIVTIAVPIVRATGGRWRIGASPAGGASMSVSWPRAFPGARETTSHRRTPTTEVSR